MSRFYITQIAASGPKVTFSSVALKDGINFVVGPSNTGKSYIIGCIDFMLGSKECPFSKDDTGYDKIHMTLQSDDGYQITATRTIEEGENGDRGSNIVSIESTHPDIRSGEYRISTKEYSEFLLRLMGVAERTKIIAKQDISTEDLTFRTISHFSISVKTIFSRNQLLLIFRSTQKLLPH